MATVTSQLSYTDYSAALRAYLPSGKSHHVVEINVQWLRYTCVLYSDAQTMQGQQLKHHMAESNVMWLRYAHALVRTNKMADSCASYSSFNAYCIALWGGCFTKNHILFESFAALRQSTGLLGRFITVWENWARHTHTHTRYCSPVAHACWGLTMPIVWPYTATTCGVTFTWHVKFIFSTDHTVLFIW